MVIPMSEDFYTLEDLVTATGLGRRSLQNVVSQYELFAGDQVPRVRRRNFFSLRFTPVQFQCLVSAVNQVQQEQVSYRELFSGQPRPLGVEMASGSARSSDAPITREEYQALMDRLAALQAEVQAQRQEVRVSFDELGVFLKALPAFLVSEMGARS